MKLPGIFFFKTRMLEDLIKFYTEKLSMEIWLEQPDCTILKRDNLLLGFCQRNEHENNGMLTFFYETPEEVDEAYTHLKDIASTTPKKNDKYQIYQFFAKDPEGRPLEFQSFLHAVDMP